jgi:hypothetical protein
LRDWRPTRPSRLRDDARTANRRPARRPQCPARPALTVVDPATLGMTLSCGKSPSYPSLLSPCMVRLSAVKVRRSVARCGWRTDGSGVEGWSGPGRRSRATSAPTVDRATRGGSGASTAAMSAAIHAMTTGISKHRRRTAVSRSYAVTTSDPVELLDRVLETFHQVNRALPKRVLTREELVALGGLLTQVSGALLTLTDLLNAPAHHYDRTRVLHANTDTTPAARPPAATSLLRDCRDGFLMAYTSARAFHADLRRCLKRP